MTRARGFTLIEMLAVIAIIGILAAITVTKIGSILEKANHTAARAEIKSIEMEMARMLVDSQRSSFIHFFDKDTRKRLHQNIKTTGEAINIYTQAAYLLLRKGRLAESDVDPLPSCLRGGGQPREQQLLDRAGKIPQQLNQLAAVLLRELHASSASVASAAAPSESNMAVRAAVATSWVSSRSNSLRLV